MAHIINSTVSLPRSSNTAGPAAPSNHSRVEIKYLHIHALRFPSKAREHSLNCLKLLWCKVKGRTTLWTWTVRRNNTRTLVAPNLTKTTKTDKILRSSALLNPIPCREQEKKEKVDRSKTNKIVVCFYQRGEDFMSSANPTESYL